MARFDRGRDFRENNDFNHGGHGADPQALKDEDRARIKDERRQSLHPVLLSALKKGIEEIRPEEPYGERLVRAIEFARAVSRWFHAGRVGNPPH